MKKNTINDDLVWEDPDTGLFWQKNVDWFNWMNLDEAAEYVEQLNKNVHAGFNDWRLPTIDELVSLGNIKLYRYDDDDYNFVKEDNDLNDFFDYKEWEKENWDKGIDSDLAEYKKLFIKKELIESINDSQPKAWTSTNTSMSKDVLNKSFDVLTSNVFAKLLGKLDDENDDSWYVNFCTGVTYTTFKENNLAVICVRGDV